MYIRRALQLGPDAVGNRVTVRDSVFIAEKTFKPETLFERALDWFRVKWVIAKRRTASKWKEINARIAW